MLANGKIKPSELFCITTRQIQLCPFPGHPRTFPRVVDAMQDDTDDLSQRVSTCLMITPTKSVTNIDTTCCQGTTMIMTEERDCHHSAYNSEASLRVETSLEVDVGDKTPPIRNKGVPGFPDFPDNWCGEEGGSTSWCRIPSNIKSQRRQRAEEIQHAHRVMLARRLKRQAVNVLPPSQCTKPGTHSSPPKRKTHKAERRHRLLTQYRQRRQMLSLQKSLKSLSFK